MAASTNSCCHGGADVRWQTEPRDSHGINHSGERTQKDLHTDQSPSDLEPLA
jgi:hypothetical protein